VGVLTLNSSKCGEGAEVGLPATSNQSYVDAAQPYVINHPPLALCKSQLQISKATCFVDFKSSGTKLEMQPFAFILQNDGGC
jgi:hypothetical protein